MAGSTDLLASVKTKVERLINQCEKQSADNSELRAKLIQLEDEKENLQQVINHLHKELEARQSEIANLNNRLEVAKNAETLNPSAVPTADVKLRINDLMREIDNCIALLSK